MILYFLRNVFMLFAIFLARMKSVLFRVVMLPILVFLLSGIQLLILFYLMPTYYYRHFLEEGKRNHIIQKFWAIIASKTKEGFKLQ